MSGRKREIEIEALDGVLEFGLAGKRDALT